MQLRARHGLDGEQVLVDERQLLLIEGDRHDQLLSDCLQMP
jgi:hypothetical protein